MNAIRSWESLTRIGQADSRVVPSTWSKDKYPDMPELYGGTSVTVLDVDGPGVITCIHASDYNDRNNSADQSAGSVIMMKVWYDFEDTPSIHMPLMDFLGDIEASCDYYDTVYFSRVKESHNFRLPMPFSRHVKIELENSSDVDLRGYLDIQWDKVGTIPESSGYLFAEYRRGQLHIPHEKLELCNISGTGAIVAHWFQISSDNPNCKRGELLCEGNDEFYLNGESAPSVEYLGTEDFYGYSYGFHETQSDRFSAIIRLDDLPSGGSRVGMLRCREADKISFTGGCVGILNYTHETFAKMSGNDKVANSKKVELSADYASCFYYYMAR